MMSSTGRSAGHEGGADWASIPALKTSTVIAYRTYTPPLYRRSVDPCSSGKRATIVLRIAANTRPDRPGVEDAPWARLIRCLPDMKRLFAGIFVSIAVFTA